MEALTFIVASASLLAAPGPTNTLLAASGAAVGIRRSLPLLAAEVGGYLTSIFLLRVVVGPVVAAAPAFALALHLAVAFYLLALAIELWRHGASEMSGGAPVTPSRVLITTLLNPKVIVFAFAILPQGREVPGLLPWLAALILLIVTIGCAWITAGATLRRGLRDAVSVSSLYHVSAVTLAFLAGAVGLHALQ